MGWITNFIVERIFGNLKSTAMSAVLTLAATLSSYGITLSEGRVQQITALVLTAIVAIERLFAKDAPKDEDKE